MQSEMSFVPAMILNNESSESESDRAWNEFAESGKPETPLTLNADGVSPYCIDPEKRCYRCHRRASGMRQEGTGCERHWGAKWTAKMNADDILPLPTVNWHEDADLIDQPPASCSTDDAIERAFATNSYGLDDDTLALPPTLAQILAQEEREADREPNDNPSPGQFVLNAPEEDDVLRLPVVNWAE